MIQHNINEKNVTQAKKSFETLYQSLTKQKKDF